MAVTKKAADDGSKSANIKPATEFEASGAIIEPAAKDVDLSHPAVDANPREHTTKRMNQIDFNEPTALKPPHKQVEDDLKDQG